MLALFEGTCRGACPGGMKARDGICIVASMADDLVLMWFPFTIASILFIFIVLAGKLKKKAILVDGRLKIVSQQNTFPGIQAFTAPLQTLCTMLQAVLCILYGYTIFFVLSLVIYLVQIGFNFGFLYWFLKSFFSKYVPAPGTEVRNKQHRLVTIT